MKMRQVRFVTDHNVLASVWIVIFGQEACTSIFPLWRDVKELFNGITR